MYINEAYLHDSRVDIKDMSKPLIVCNCGTYHLISKARVPTYRPRGRRDFQLIYIASGKGYFHFENGSDCVVNAGEIVVYRPKEIQDYEYYGSDHTEAYWVHFTGKDAKILLRKYGMRDDSHVFYIGTSLEYQRLFKKMIWELQMCKEGYEELLSILLNLLFINIYRKLKNTNVYTHNYLEREIEAAAKYFYDNYNQDINISSFAASKNMSTCWFIQNFKSLMGTTPMQYILSIRLANAERLLETTDYNVTEISRLVGYDNPLYFSRLFKNKNGISPSEFRKKLPS